jgi:hypothetical protein
MTKLIIFLLIWLIITILLVEYASEETKKQTEASLIEACSESRSAILTLRNAYINLSSEVKQGCISPEKQNEDYKTQEKRFGQVRKARQKPHNRVDNRGREAD